MIKKSENFDNNLKFLIDETGKKNNKEEMNSDIVMLRMRQKLDEKMKNKKDKEKRERKRLREEQEMNKRIFSQKSMSDMVDLMENNILKNNMGFDKKKDELNININTNMNEKNENMSEENIRDTNNPDKNKKNNEKAETSVSKPEAKNDNDNNNENENDNAIIGQTLDKKKMEQTATSSYSKLTSNDYGPGLIKECFSIHDFNININDRIKLFKTLILPLKNKEIENKYKNLPKININSSSTNQTLIKSNSCSCILDKSKS